MKNKTPGRFNYVKINYLTAVISFPFFPTFRLAADPQPRWFSADP